jgi:hypothetical protein
MRKADEPEVENVGFKMPVSQHKALKTAATILEREQGDILNEGLVLWLKAHESELPGNVVLNVTEPVPAKLSCKAELRLAVEAKLMKEELDTIFKGLEQQNSNKDCSENEKYLVNLHKHMRKVLPRVFEIQSELEQHGRLDTELDALIAKAAVYLKITAKGA